MQPQPQHPPEPAARTNRLATQTSPYLLQHAHNPVDWYPWGKEAFEEARRRDVPIFLSVGYSTCYWCHVMERESFENEAIAAQMNRDLVCIKVDREERPDVDDIYMTAVQALTSSGGWPMNVFLEPGSLKPFWGGTYFPPEPKFGRPGFPQIMAGIAEAWRTQRADVLKQAEELAEAVRERIANKRAPVNLGERQVAQAIGSLLKMHDRVNGGFGAAPKFPQPVYLELLLRFRGHAGDEETGEGVDAAIRQTLDRMATGGMCDQVGGGFHRYSTDEKWLVPHFEKMLYDNAQLAAVYAKASRVYGDEFYARVARRTVEYVIREMSSTAGGFFSAQDAEVNHREGQNYLWKMEEFRQVLGDEDGEWAGRAYGLKSGPNFRDPHHPEDSASNVLFLSYRPEGVARRMGMEPAEFLARLDRVNDLLYAARSKRDQPGTDDKVLCGWNGLMIGAMALAGSVLERPEYIARAERAAEFVLGNMREPGKRGAGGGGLLRSWRNVGERTEAKIPAFFEDYAFMIHGLLELHRAGRDGRGRYLEEAISLTSEVESRFGDAESGGYFDTLAEQEDLFVRSRSEYDGAVPSGSSVMLNNLLDLAEIVGGEQGRRYRERAARCLAAMSAFISATPVGAANSTRGLLRLLTVERGAAALAAVLSTQGESPPKPDEDHADPVGVFASVGSVVIGEGEPGALVLQVRIAPGYHVNAADPGPGGADLIGLRVKVINGTGVAAYADYPKGEEYRPGWSDAAEPIRVYTGILSIPVALERVGGWSGRPILAVTYQACTDTACLEPRTVELDVAIDRR